MGPLLISRGSFIADVSSPLQGRGEGAWNSGVSGMSLLSKLAEAEKRYEELINLMAQPEVATDPARLREYGQESAELAKVVVPFREYKALGEELSGTQKMLGDDLDQEMRELVEAELQALETRQSELEERLKRLLLPKDPRDDKNVIMEIRAGTGGEEAALFAADLYRMYSRYAEKQNWKTEVLSSNITLIKGKGAYSRLKFESGAHRVQRVPTTESSGRIHTSAATVAVLPEVEEVEISIDPNDLRIDVFRAGGHGGQSVNTTARTNARNSRTRCGACPCCAPGCTTRSWKDRRRRLTMPGARRWEREIEAKRSAPTTSPRTA